MPRKKDDSIFEGILGAFAIIGGAWLGIEILKSISKKEIVYDCPVCKFPVKYGINSCPNCNSKLSWPSNDGNN